MTTLITIPALAWKPANGNWGLIGQVPRYHHCSPYNLCPACRQAREITLREKEEQEKQHEQDIAELKQLHAMKEALRVLQIAELQEAIGSLRFEKDTLQEKYSNLPESKNSYWSRVSPTDAQMLIKNQMEDIDNKIASLKGHITALRGELKTPAATPRPVEKTNIPIHF